MRNILVYLIVTVSLFRPFFAHAQNGDSSAHVSILPVPTMGYSPETWGYLGAVCLFNFPMFKNSGARNSNAKVEFSLTQRRQRILELQWNLFSRRENFFYFGNTVFSKYVDYYWGIGPTTPGSNRSTFNAHRDLVYAGMAKNTGNKFFIGGALKWQQYLNIQPSDSNSLLQNVTNLSTWGINLLCFKDTRNSLLNAESGRFIRFIVSQNIFRQENSWQNYQKLELDARGYRKYKEKLVFAGRALLQSMSGVAPFFDYNLLGGDNNMRGFYMGRFRDKHIALVQAETRLNVYRRWGLALFGGGASVFPNPGAFSSKSLKFNIGGGLRFMVDRKERINMRIDYALGSGDNQGFYVAFGESF